MFKRIAPQTPGTAGIPQTETMTNPSETKLVELSDEGRIDAVFDRLAAEGRTIRRYKLLTPEVEAKIADLESALASLADELRLAREEQIALLRFIQKEHPVTPEMWNALFPKEPL